MSDPRFLPLGDTALAVEFGAGIDRHISAQVMTLDQRIIDARLTGFIEAVPSFRSLMIQFDPLLTDPERIVASVKELLDGLAPSDQTGRHWKIPTCYQGQYAPDLESIAAQVGLSPEEVISLHTGTEQFNYMTGFLPGNPYLGDLPEVLNIPRRENPRTRLPRGSVAIAVGLTVIYPVDSPGGWNLIGRTPVPLFDATADPPALIAPGDYVVFDPISETEYERIETAVAAGEWTPKHEAQA